MKNQHILIQLTRFILCAVSIVLTGLFALSFTSSIGGGRFGLLPQLLMILIGIGIDMSKYLFWSRREQHFAFFILSLTLVSFSCMASIAFFVTQERQQVDYDREKTYAFQSYRAEIENLEREILAKQKLVDTRLASKYHEQWDKGDKASVELGDLRKKLSVLIEKGKDVGLQEARQNVSTSAFFLSISSMLGVSFELVVTASYSALALLIEIAALGMIALSSNVYAKGQDYTVLLRNDGIQDRELSKTEQAKRDVSSGLVPPVVRQLIKNYRIQYKDARNILDELEQEGMIKKQGRIYVLTNNYQN